MSIAVSVSVCQFHFIACGGMCHVWHIAVSCHPPKKQAFLILCVQLIWGVSCHPHKNKQYPFIIILCDQLIWGVCRSRGSANVK